MRFYLSPPLVERPLAVTLVVLAVVVASVPFGASADPPPGQGTALSGTHWCARLLYDGVRVPFRLSFGPLRDGALHSGNEAVPVRIRSSDGQHHTVQIENVDSFLLIDRADDGRTLSGRWASTVAPYWSQTNFEATLAMDDPTCGKEQPTRAQADRLTGRWGVTATSGGSGSNHGVLTIQELRGRLEGVMVLSMDGDKGSMDVRATDSGMVLSNFNGLRALWFVGKRKGQELEGTSWLNGTQVAEWRGAPMKTDTLRFLRFVDKRSATRVSTTLKRFSGKPANLERFAGGVSVITVFATWCANCHSWMEALRELKAKHPNLRTLSVVADMTEDRLAEKTALEHYLARSRDVTANDVLFMTGKTDRIEQELRSSFGMTSDDIGRFPVALFIDADLRVRAVLTGFPGRAARDEHDTLVAQIDTVIRELTAQAKR